MSLTREWFVRGVHIVCMLVVLAGLWPQAAALADPTREEAYRNDNLRVVVYKDGQDPTLYWYLPPLRWLTGDDGRITYYKRPRGDGRTDYFFYVIPYMTPELTALIASEIPNVTSDHQLRPLTLKRLGIRVPQFEATAVGTDATDYQYINSPQLLRMSFDPIRAEEFEFFMNNVPGIRADVLFFYLGERVDRYIQLELSCRDVYTAMRVGLQGRYEFLQADIEDRVFEYLTNKYLYIRSKGDIAMPDIVNRAIAECFTPIPQPRMTLLTANEPEVLAAARQQYELFLSILAEPGSCDASADGSNIAFDDLVVPLPGPGGGGTRPLPGAPGTAPITTPITNPGGGGGGFPPITTNPPLRPPGGAPPPNGPVRDGIFFGFRSEMAQVERSFIFRREQVTSFEEVTVVPMTLSYSATNPTPPTGVVTEPLPQWDGIVRSVNDQGRPLSSGMIVQPGDQVLITATFALWVASSYDAADRRRARWDTGWGKVEDDLYYRVGTGPWIKVGGRALIRSDGLNAGELQFYQDRAHVWERIPPDLKRRRFLLPPALTYAQTFPEFTVTVTGRRQR